MRVYEFVHSYASVFIIYKDMKGTSIIELIIYGAILAFLSVFAINGFLVISSALTEVRLRQRVNADAELVMGRLMREIRFGKSVYASSIFGAHPSRLSFVTFASPDDDAEVNGDISVSGTNLLFQKGVNTALRMNTSNVSVVNFILRHIATTTSVAIKIELTLEASTTGKTVRENFYGTAVMRGSY